MSQTKSQLVAPVGILTASGISVSGILTASSVNASSINASGIITASNVNASGISTLGSVRIASGIVTATSGVVTYYGDGSNLNLTGNTTAGVSSTGSVNTVGVVTASIIDAFIPVDQKVVSTNLTINNNQNNVTFAEDLVVNTGATFTVSTGSTVNINTFEVLNIPYGTIYDRPSPATAGSLRYNNTVGSLEFYDGSRWKSVTLTNNLIQNVSDTGIIFGGTTNVVEYITISTLGVVDSYSSVNSSDIRQGIGGCSSSTRGLFGGGLTPGPSPGLPATQSISSVSFTSTGSVSNFGTLTSRTANLAACSNSTRGVFGGGTAYTPLGAVTNVLEYVTIATTGNAIDFGDLTVARQQLAACSSSTRGVFGGSDNTIDYITIASTGNATDFGDLTLARGTLAACSTSTRGVFGGGSPSTNTIDYITIATTGNAADFGDLTVARSNLSSCSNSTRGVFFGGTPFGAIDYITIAAMGNASNFGSITPRTQTSACSSAHGGLS